MSNATAVSTPLPSPAPASAPSAILRAENVQRVFVDGTRRLEILKGANLQVYPGEVVALVGKSGSGKSTLLHLAGLLDTPSAGEIFVDGTPTGKLGENARAFLRNQTIGFVFQHFFLLPEFSVLENVMMPARMAWSLAGRGRERPKHESHARELLTKVGLGDRLDQKPATLSGGERQRVGLARALVLQPRLLLCDEPTGNLDPETAVHIMNLLFELSRLRQTAVLIVTHDRTISARADRVFGLDAGVLAQVVEKA